MQDFTVILPSFKNPKLLFNCINSFEKFKPNSISINYIVVENSTQDHYVEELQSKFPTVKWICNKDAPRNGSDANASALELGTKNCETDLLFMCHTDVAVLHENFYKCLFNKINEGYSLVGFRTDTHPARVGAIHQSGIFTYKDIASKSNLFGNYVHWRRAAKSKNKTFDCGDGITIYCRENKLKIYCYENTFNDFPIDKVENLKLEPSYPKVNAKKPIFDFSVDDNNILVYSHLGRGSSKKSRLNFWFNFCKLYL